MSAVIFLSREEKLNGHVRNNLIDDLKRDTFPCLDFSSLILKFTKVDTAVASENFKIDSKFYQDLKVEIFSYSSVVLVGQTGL